MSEKITVGFVSLGCNKNAVDTEVMIALCAQGGYEIVSDAADADVLVVNTCAFIDDAKEESVNTILEMAKYKENRCRLLVAAGCMAQRYADEMEKLLPEVDVLVGVGSVSDIANAIKKGIEGKKARYMGDKNAPCENDLPRVLTTPSYCAYLKIGEGCDNFCTYCAIPAIRGKYRSRDFDSLIDEAKALCENGVREIIVVAQNTTRYGVDLYKKSRLASLLRALCRIEKLEWVRVHYCYPEEIDEELIDTIASEEKIVKYLDMPIQHASDAVLKRMGRRCTKAELEELIANLRAKIKGIVIRTSLIAGFPGETEAQFEELCDFCRTAALERVGVFAYSQEEGTAAARMEGQIDEETKRARAAHLMELCKEISLEYNKSRIGKTYKVLCEGFDENLYVGRTYGESIEVDGKIYFAAQREIECGEFVDVETVDCDEYDLYGRMI